MKMNGNDISQLASMPLPWLMEKALKTKLKYRGSRFSLCTIMNARSGRCTEDCAFCAQSARYNTSIAAYSLRSSDEAVREAERARNAGAERFSLVTSGRGMNSDEVRHVAETIHAIRSRVDIKVCCSLGILDGRSLSCLKDAGMSRYHHNLETSSRFFPHVVSTHSFQERIDTIRAAKEVGLEVCSGGIIGLGETEEDRISMACTLAELDVDSVPVNLLVPIEGTPLAGAAPLKMTDILRTIAIFRLILPEKALRIAGGRESRLGDFQAMAFWAGADAMLIGGYLTVRGREIEKDIEMVRQVRELWKSVSLH